MTTVEVPRWFCTFGTIFVAIPAASKADARAIIEARLRAHGLEPRRGEVKIRQCKPEDDERLNVIQAALDVLPGKPSRY